MFLVALLMVLGACQMETPLKITNAFKADIRYFRDDRTDLCFAGVVRAVYGGYTMISITNVPCTPSVIARSQMVAE